MLFHARSVRFWVKLETELEVHRGVGYRRAQTSAFPQCVVSIYFRPLFRYILYPTDSRSFESIED